MDQIHGVHDDASTRSLMGHIHGSNPWSRSMHQFVDQIHGQNSRTRSMVPIHGGRRMINSINHVHQPSRENVPPQFLRDSYRIPQGFIRYCKHNPTLMYESYNQGILCSDPHWCIPFQKWNCSAPDWLQNIPKGFLWNSLAMFSANVFPEIERSRRCGRVCM